MEHHLPMVCDDGHRNQRLDPRRGSTAGSTVESIQNIGRCVWEKEIIPFQSFAFIICILYTVDMIKYIYIYIIHSLDSKYNQNI